MNRWGWPRITADVHYVKLMNRLGGGRIVFIKQVTVRNVARYLSKYLTKELLLSAPKGTRRITTARSIKLFPKFDSGISWELIRESIWHLLTRHSAAAFARFGRGTCRHHPGAAWALVLGNHPRNIHSLGPGGRTSCGWRRGEAIWTQMDPSFGLAGNGGFAN